MTKKIILVCKEKKNIIEQVKKLWKCLLNINHSILSKLNFLGANWGKKGRMENIRLFSGHQRTPRRILHAICLPFIFSLWPNQRDSILNDSSWLQISFCHIPQWLVINFCPEIDINFCLIFTKHIRNHIQLAKCNRNDLRNHITSTLVEYNIYKRKQKKKTSNYSSIMGNLISIKECIWWWQPSGRTLDLLT